MAQHILTKTDFIHYLNCPKSLWFLKNKPEEYPHRVFSEFLQKITREGYEVEGYAKKLFPDGVDLPATPQAAEKTQRAIADGTKTLFQPTFQTADGMLVRVDVLVRNDDGSYDLYEVKSTTEVSRKKQHSHIQDVCFQKVVLEECGLRVAKTFLIIMNKEYRRRALINPEDLLRTVDVTEEVESIRDVTQQQMLSALAFIREPSIDESSCLCYFKTRSNHCDAFAYFNGVLDIGSIYELSRITEKKVSILLGRGVKHICDVPEDIELSETQMRQVCAVRQDGPAVHKEEIQELLASYTFPLYFLDYETVQTAVPEVIGSKPWQQIPFQFSLHTLNEDGSLLHQEYLSHQYDGLDDFVTALRQHIGATGSIVSWNKAFEQMVNRGVADLRPASADFLNDVNNRMVDLMDVFKKAYVDRAFCGSCSIKKVLPVLCPEFSYKALNIQDGAQAMSQWEIMVHSETPESQRKEIQDSLLAYCALDTLAMVKIYQVVTKAIA